MAFPITMQLSDLRTAAKQRADMVFSNFLTTAEWNQVINQSYLELYDLLIEKYESDYFVQTPYSFSTDGVNVLFPLPPDFYKLKGLDVQLTGVNTGQWFTVRRINFSERNKYNLPTALSGYRYSHLGYKLVGANIMLQPLPQAGLSFRLWYAPRLTPLVLDTDVADGLSGWLEYVIVDAAIKALAKEESDTSELVREKQGLLARIDVAAGDRDAGNPPTVSDTRHANLFEEPEW
jgi:hypothetical protein